jgi:hypothetical protein
MNANALLLTLFSEPSKAYAAIEERGRPWYPLMLLMLGNALFMAWYFSGVDFDWLRDYMISNNPDLAAPEQRKAAESFMTRSTMTWSSVAGVLIGTPLMTAITGLYFLLVGKAFALEHRYGQWFAFAAWSAAPTLLTLPVRALQFQLATNGQIAPEALNLLSLNELVLHLEPGHAWKTLADSVDLTMLWAIALSAIGLKTWSQRGWAACVIAAVLPYALVFGIWAARILGSE